MTSYQMWPVRCCVLFASGRLEKVAFVQRGPFISSIQKNMCIRTQMAVWSSRADVRSTTTTYDYGLLTRINCYLWCDVLGVPYGMCVTYTYPIHAHLKTAAIQIWPYVKSEVAFRACIYRMNVFCWARIRQTKLYEQSEELCEREPQSMVMEMNFL